MAFEQKDNALVARLQFGDFVTAFADGGYEKGARPLNAVPEPGMSLVWVGIAILTARLRRR